MSSRLEIESINKKIQDIDNQMNGLYSEKNKLYENKNELIIQLLNEELLFDNTEWTIINFSNGLLIKYIGKSYDEKFEAISDLIEDAYHCSFTLNDDVIIRFDDHIVTIKFKDLKVGLNFIEKNNLLIDKSSIESIYNENLKNCQAAIFILNSLK